MHKHNHPNFVIADVAGNWREDFMEEASRLALIGSVTSRNYAAIGSRHRGALYSHVLEELLRGEAVVRSLPVQTTFRFPYIL